jgi:hypothetical protein
LSVIIINMPGWGMGRERGGCVVVHPVYMLQLFENTVAIIIELSAMLRQKVILHIYIWYISFCNLFMTSGTYMSHLQRDFSSFCWDNSIPLFLHAAIHLKVSLFHWTSQNAFSHVQMILCAMLHAALHTGSFAQGCFAGKWILTGSME